MKPAVEEAIPHFFLWRRYGENRDLASQEHLIKQYLHLVEQMANRISVSIPKNIIAKEDLLGLGYIGLIEAIKKFDYTKGYQFETYGLWRIKGAILDGIRKMDWVPRGLREKAKKINVAFRQLEQSLMRPPTEEELSAYLNMSLKEVDQATATLSLSTLLSLNEPVSGNDEEGNKKSRLEQIRDDNFQPLERQAQMAEFRQMIAESIEKMPEKEGVVISLLYYEGLTQIEVAQAMNLTKGRISQIHSKAILHLRKSFVEKGFSLDSFI